MSGLFALALVTRAPLVAQQGPDWLRLQAWADSLEQVTEPSGIAHLRPLAAAPGQADATLRMTLWRLRHAAISLEPTALDLAGHNAVMDMMRHQSAGLIPLAAARALLAFEMERVPPIGGSLVLEGEAYIDATWRYVRQGMERDATLAPLRSLGRDLLVLAGDRIMHDDASTTLRILLQDRFPHPDVLLAAARYQRAEGRPDSTLHFLNRAGLAGGDAAVLALERAWTLLAMGDSTTAEDAYWHGVARMTPAGRTLYRYDLSWLLTDELLAEFDAVPAEKLAPWLRHFWMSRDVDAVNTLGGRLREHLRRRVYALEHFRLTTPWRRTHFERVEIAGFDPPRPCGGRPPLDLYGLLGRQPSLPGDPRRLELLLDHRGAMYMRHGEPMERVSRVMPGVDALYAQNESWLYLMAGFQRMLHFQGSRALGAHAATTLRSSLPVNRDLYTSRGNLLGAYADALFDFDNPVNADPALLECESGIAGVTKQSQDDAALAVTSDSDAPPVTTPWPASIRLHQVGDPAAGTNRVLLTYAAPTPLLTRESSDGGRDVFPFEIRLVGYDAAGERYVQIDTVQRLSVPKDYRGNWVGAWLEVPFPIGTWRASTLITQAEADGKRGGAMQLRPVLTVDGSDAPLRVSDLVAGRRDGLPWTAPDGQPFLVNPTMVWSPDVPMDLYFEVHGLAPDTPFQTSFQIMGSGETTPSLDIRGTAEASGPHMVMRRALDLRRLQTGRYQVRLEISAGALVVRRTQEFIVEK